MIKRSSIRAVFWDLGGVIVRTHDRSGRTYWEKRLGLQPNELDRLVFRGETSRKASIGQASTADIWSSVGDHLDLDRTILDKLILDFWRGDRVDTDLVDFIRSLRPAFLTGLISNGWSDLRHALEHEWHFVDAFDDIVISAEVGLVKPSPEIYHLALERMNIEARHAVFIDDFEENVDGARAVNMHAIHFQSPQQVISELQTLLDLES
jgi:epoxide hydrolase-like predicted phosphatase